jgi:hypothetical protein
MIDLKNIQPYQVTSSPLDKIFLIYGEPGTRKTTVAVGDTEHTLLLAFEIGYKFIPGVYRVDIPNWVALKQALAQIDDPEVKAKFTTIAIDTIGLAYKACISYICAQKGVEEIGKIPFGQGYSMAKNEFEKTINSIPQRGYGLVLVAHSDEMNDEKNGVSVKVDIDKRPSAVIKGLADFILYTRKEVKDGTTDEMTVYAYSSTKNEHIEVKSRARFFPKRFEFTYQNLLAGLKLAIEEQDKFFNIKSVEKPNFASYQINDTVDIKEIQGQVLELATMLFETSASDLAENVIKENLPGIRIRETTHLHLAALFAIKDRLTEIKNSL